MKLQQILDGEANGMFLRLKYLSGEIKYCLVKGVIPNEYKKIHANVLVPDKGIIPRIITFNSHGKVCQEILDRRGMNDYTEEEERSIFQKLQSFKEYYEGVRA